MKYLFILDESLHRYNEALSLLNFYLKLTEIKFSHNLGFFLKNLQNFFLSLQKCVKKIAVGILILQSPSF